jgi:S1-C subfamily serine protease
VPAATPAATAATVAASPTPVAADTVLDVGNAIADVAAATEPSVVTIAATGFGRGASAGGSGIVVSADGLILTTTVVVPTDGTYDILLADEREGTASVVASDTSRGLVLLRTGLADLEPARLAESAALVIGQRVIAIGSPLGEFTDTVTAGIISSLGRAINLRDPSSGRRVALDGLIQTDAAINAGSSGGPLLDISGTVVGVIATSASTGEGIGFAIPIEAATDLLARAGS